MNYALLTIAGIPVAYALIGVVLCGVHMCMQPGRLEWVEIWIGLGLWMLFWPSLLPVVSVVVRYITSKRNPQ